MTLQQAVSSGSTVFAFHFWLQCWCFCVFSFSSFFRQWAHRSSKLEYSNLLFFNYTFSSDPTLVKPAQLFPGPNLNGCLTARHTFQMTQHRTQKRKHFGFHLWVFVFVFCVTSCGMCVLPFRGCDERHKGIWGGTGKGMCYFHICLSAGLKHIPIDFT